MTDEDSLFLPETDSTNNYLRTLSQQQPNLPNGFVVFTDYQSTGRGQVGNRWCSEKGKNLLFTILLYPNFLSLSNQFYLSKVVALAVLDVLRESFSDYASDFSIKWPNDIYYKEKKLAGILIENTVIGGKIVDSIVGIGLNVNQTNFPSDIPNPISIASIIGQEYSREQLLQNLQKRIVEMTQLLSDENNFAAISDCYLQLLYKRLKKSLFIDCNGQFEAQIVNVQPSGKLVLQINNGDLKVYSFKEVEYIL